MPEKLQLIKITPPLVSNFDKIRENPELEPTINDFSPIFSEQKYRKHCFEESKNAFRLVFNKEEFKTKITQGRNDNNFQYLKRIRRQGMILRDVYKFVDSKHKSNKQLKEFISLLGDYNDKYWLINKIDPENEVLLGFDIPELSVDLCTNLDFIEYSKNILSKIDRLIQERTLPVSKFHSLRIMIRSFASLIQCNAAEKPGSAAHALFYSIYDLSTKMGNSHDKLIEKSLLEKIKYEESELEIKQKIAIKWTQIRPLIEKVCGITN